ncbi:hypothetical protein PMZ80_003293 [Knufia obscura]|uniref:Uncharacterized protein n=2 Tax=Knufia TaxID=430999 RepID=A0AAN8F3D3_9EURO|nr:hypothetical protein PMZ80_003293 [Knufia obscura]KAK5950411.1 hypothetical protein OHC33_008630 [Knufia fluminis]
MDIPAVPVDAAGTMLNYTRDLKFKINGAFLSLDVPVVTGLTHVAPPLLDDQQGQAQPPA